MKYLVTGDRNFEYLFGGPNKGILLNCDENGRGDSTVLIHGHSGTGKTLLACQLCISSMLKNWPDGYAVIYSLDQEPDKLRNLIVNFKWLEEDQIGIMGLKGKIIPNGKKLFIRKMEAKKISDLWTTINMDLNNSEIRIVVIDAINSLIKHDSGSEYFADFRELVGRIHPEGYPIVKILTLEKISPNQPLEEYVPNCVIELMESGTSQPERTIRIKKARNQKHFSGTHNFEIKNEEVVSNNGIFVYPSLSAQSAGNYSRENPFRLKGDFIDFGEKKIDEGLKEIELDGLKRGSVTLMWGDPGSKKTEHCAKFLLAGLLEDEEARVLFITFKIEEEAFFQFLNQQDTFENEMKNKIVTVDGRKPFELPTKAFARIIEELVVNSKADKITRAVVFGLRRLEQLTAYKGSSHEFLEVLVRTLHNLKISTLLIDWPDPHSPAVTPMAIDLCSNEISMTRNETILKRIDYHWHEHSITQIYQVDNSEK